MSQPSAAKPVILVVDDTPENIDVLRGILGADYSIKIATSGELALKVVAAQPPDLILLDVMMPGMDGYEVCKQLKANPRTRAIPVIFVTARTETVDEVQGLALGAVDYLAKPVIPAIVKARVQTQLALRQARHELEEKNLILSDEKELLEDIVTRMRSASPFDERKVRHIQSSLERTAGDIVLSAYRPDGAQHVLVGDFSGHGLTAAFGGPLVSYIFYRLTAEGCAMRLIFEEINRILCRQLPTQLYMAAAALELPPDREQAMVWNCGMPPVLCLSAAHDVGRISSSGLPLGISEAIDTFEHHALAPMKPGMRIYLYSDGITEATSTSQELYGQSRLETLVLRIYREQLTLEMIWQELDAFCGGQGLSDDAVMVETAL
ncbi:MAG: SpoIIE family protein phosphatase [Gallionella sp.]|nr:SpoIIE family protein phosphatase [Gallionella sp.]